MLGYRGPVQPSPTLGDALNAGYLYLEVRCLGCDTHPTVKPADLQQKRSSGIMRFVEPRPFANPDAAARKLAEIANGVEVVQDGRIYNRARQRAVSGGWRQTCWRCFFAEPSISSFSIPRSVGAVFRSAVLTPMMKAISRYSQPP
jgi:hypothetical protein